MPFVQNNSWKIRNNTITGSQRPDRPGGGYLVTKDSWKNFELRFDFKIVPHNAESGVIIRAPYPEENNPKESGYEIQILDRDDAPYRTGSIIGLAQSISPKPVRGWNTMKILAYNQLIRVHLNGRRVAEAFGTQQHAGRICFHCCGGKRNKTTRSLFRNIRIRRLSDPPAEIEEIVKKLPSRNEV
jgi:hypothetical protein